MFRRRALDPRQRTVLAAVLANPVREILPLGAGDAVANAMPRGARVSVTASPSRPIEATVDLAVRLQAAGFHAIPHLAARMIRDGRHVRGLLSRISDAGIGEIFVVGGDGVAVGQFSDGLALLRAISESGQAPPAIGIPGYPDGHATIPMERLLEALAAKAPLATTTTTQLCFDAAAVDRWIRTLRRDGVALPVVLGVPGAIEPRRLATIGARIGVRDTRRFVRRNLGFVGRLLRTAGHYRPDQLLIDLAPTIADPSAGVAGLHLYTFNQVAATEAWRVAYLARLQHGEAA